jgi:hypothetical protein
MMRAREHDAERRENGEKSKVLSECDHVEDRERGPERECKAAERG